MSPYLFNPRTIQNVAAAKYVIGLFDQEIAASVARKKPLEENVSAIFDLLTHHMPENGEAMAEDLATLISAAQDLGHEEGNRQNIDTLKSQFMVSLPWAIKKELQGAG